MKQNHSDQIAKLITELTNILLHVDNMVVAGKNDECAALHKFLNLKFPTNNLSELAYFMGCSFSRNRKTGTLTMSQESSIDKLIERFHVSKTNPVPACPSVELYARRKREARTKEPQGGRRTTVGGRNN